jgi:hypothetical protein
MAYEDFVMRQVDARTSPHDKVFDGVGRALRREPAYRYWFLPALVPVLEKAGRIKPYTFDDPPAAIIADYRVYTYLQSHPALASLATSHYLPVWRNLWIPAMTAIGTGEWRCPADGVYRVYKSAALARHPWFRQPLEAGTLASNLPPLDLRTLPSETVTLRRNQRVHVDAGDGVAIFIVPANETVFFRQPPAGVTLDAVEPARTHVPRLQ